MSEPVSISYFSDVLCVWAYVAQIKIDELRRNFGDGVVVDERFVSIFGNTSGRIGKRWAERGGFRGYADHVREVGRGFPHVEINPDVWGEPHPASSLSAHLFARAARLVESRGGIDAARIDAFDGRTAVEELTWRLRVAFFRDCQDLSRRGVQERVAAGLELPIDGIRAHIEDGTAFAALAADHEAAASLDIAGSPTLAINEGRQKLYGNVGYRIIEANVQELMRDDRDVASWC